MWHKAVLWVFVESPMRGRIEREMDIVINAIKAYLQTAETRG
jgi:hypothetical protein